MPNLRQQALKKAFQALKESGAKTIYRWEEQPERMLRSGFRRSSFITPGEPEALYWGHTPDEARVLKWGDPGYAGGFSEEEAAKKAKLVEGVILPGTKTKSYSAKDISGLIDKAEKEAEEWYAPSLAYREGLNRKLTKQLKKDADMVFAPDVMQSPDIEQIAQLKRGKVLAKIGDRYRILGLGVALGAGGAAMAGPEEAEAAPYGKIGQVMKKVTKGAVSSAAKDLKGEILMVDGAEKKIKNVVKGKGDWRHVQFTDGTERAMTKDVLTEYMQEVGAGKYTGSILESSENPLLQAGRSLELHLKRQNPFNSKKLKQEWLTTRQEHVKTLGREPVPYVYVIAGPGENNRCYLPEKYATILEREGRVKIER